MKAFRSGALFRRMDLQVHTPRDPRWEGAKVGGIESGMSELEVVSARTVWAKGFVDACVEAGIGAVACTDHHDWELVKYVQVEAAERQQQDNQFDLWVYPGVEVTCRDSAQCLLIFDADMPLETVDRLRSKFNLPSDCKSLDSLHPEIDVLQLDVEKLQDLLSADTELLGRFIILPNLKPHGHKTLLRKGFQKRYANLPYVGGYFDRMKPSAVTGGDRKILDGEVEEWGFKRMPIVNTSDARDFDQIGKDTPWVKVGDKTAEALRQAFLASDSRISEDLPQLPASYVGKIKVTSAKVLQDIDETLNPQLVALIGGRGSGKSTVLEYLRFVLGDSALDVEGETHVLQRRRSLIEDTLVKCAGAVEAEIVVNGSRSLLRRTGAQPNVIIQVIGDRTIELTPKEIRGIFPFQAYSQGELSLLGERDAGEKVKILVLAPRDEEMSRMEAHITSLRSNMRSAFEDIVQSWRTNIQMHQVQNQLENLREQFAAITSSMHIDPSPGVNLADARSKVAAVSTKIQLTLSDLENWLRWLKSAPKPKAAIKFLSDELSQLQDLPQFNQLALMVKSATAAACETFEKTIELAAGSVQSEVQNVREFTHQWNVLKDDLETRCQLAATQEQELSGALAQRTELEGRIEATEGEIRQLSDQLESLRGPSEEFIRVRGALANLRLEQRKVLADAAQQFGVLSNGLARASIVVGGRREAAREAIERLVAGTRTRAERMDNLFSWIHRQGDPHAAWQQVQQECMEHLKWHEAGGKADQRPKCEALTQHLPEAALSRIDSDRLVEVVSTFLEDEVELQYVRGTDQVPFNTASPGEQATALLAVLLSQKVGPLLLDQPEDDLDNKIISEIVQNAKVAKQSRQLVTSTHNANLVVNGDADQILYFEPVQTPAGRYCELKTAGAIDCAHVKSAITTTMEGGRQAFELRRTKYQF